MRKSLLDQGIDILCSGAVLEEFKCILEGDEVLSICWINNINKSAQHCHRRSRYSSGIDCRNTLQLPFTLLGDLSTLL